jgi:hypothetical protein
MIMQRINEVDFIIVEIPNGRYDIIGETHFQDSWKF